MSILLDRVDEERIKLDLTGAGFGLSQAWNKMLEKVKKANSNGIGNEYIIVDLIVACDNGGLTSYKYKAEISVVVRKEDLYIVGLELAKGEYREFPNVEYSQYYHLHFNNVDEKRRKLMLTVQTIGDGIAQIENDISNPAQKIDDMYFRKKNSCITITNIAFIISEAARFEFVRDTVKRIYGYLSNDEITQIYLNPKSSGRWYNYRPYYRDLLDHYSKIAIASNKGEKNLHNEMLTVDECREYYSDTVKFPDDYPNLEELRKIGLIERK